MGKTKNAPKHEYYRYIIRQEIEKRDDGFNYLLALPDEPSLDGCVSCFPFKLVNGKLWMESRVDMPVSDYVSETEPIDEKYAFMNSLWAKAYEWLRRSGVYPLMRKNIHKGRVTM